jgi:hypothetical protein
MNRSWPGRGVSWGEPSGSDMPAAAARTPRRQSTRTPAGYACTRGLAAAC